VVEIKPKIQEALSFRHGARARASAGKADARTRLLRLALALWLLPIVCCAETVGWLADQTDAERLLLDRLMLVESGGRQFAKNPRSSALGPFQFVKGTFLELIRRKKPDLTAGKSVAELLRLRCDPKISRGAALIYIREAAKLFNSQNFGATPANLRLAFFLGHAGALKVLAASSDRPVSSILNHSTLAANPWLKRLSAGQLIHWSSLQVEGVAMEEASPELASILSGQGIKQAGSLTARATEIALTLHGNIPEALKAEEREAVADAPDTPQVRPVVSVQPSERERPVIASLSEQADGTELHVACNLKLASCRKWVVLAEKRSQLTQTTIRGP
jgi:hypothetical protein